LLRDGLNFKRPRLAAVVVADEKHSSENAVLALATAALALATASASTAVAVLAVLAVVP
jgi:hypothetical protein